MVKIGRIQQGAEFIEADCYTCARGKDSMPKLVFKKHNGYGTGHYPPRTDILEALKAIIEHDKDRTHKISLWFGKG